MTQTNTTSNTERNLQFGLTREVPATATAAWGARWIFPDDMLADRQGTFGWETPDGERLKKWLNGGALKKAREFAASEAKNYRLSSDDDKTITLFEDVTGIIVGSPNRSYGYLYVAGWLKEKGGVEKGGVCIAGAPLLPGSTFSCGEPDCVCGPPDASTDPKICGYCQRRKRGWRTLNVMTLCAECERKVQQ